MATGRRIQLARQIGEYLVAAELGRRGWVATTFTGSLPGFDLLAINEDGRIIEVQVKTLRTGTWQLDAGQYIEVVLEKDVQRVAGPLVIKTAGRVFAFVRIADNAPDEYYLCTLHDLQQLLLRTYRAGKRPKNPRTLHHSLPPKDLAQFKDNWAVLDAAAKRASA